MLLGQCEITIAVVDIAHWVSIIVQADVVIERDDHIAEVPPDVNDREPIPSNQIDVGHVRPDVHLGNEGPIQVLLHLRWNQVLLSVAPVVLGQNQVDAEI
jgi:hypothetical protein